MSLHLNQTPIQATLDAIADRRFLRFDPEKQTIVASNPFTWLLDKLQGVFGYKDWSSEKLIEFKLIHLLHSGKEQIKSEEQLKKVNQVAKQLGLFADQPESIESHRHLYQVISNLADRVLSLKEESSKVDPVWSFYAQHWPELEKFSDIAQKILQSSVSQPSPPIARETHETSTASDIPKSTIYVPIPPISLSEAEKSVGDLKDTEAEKSDGFFGKPFVKPMETPYVSTISNIEQQPPIVGIRNPHGTNACYRNSSNQALRTLKPIMKKLAESIKDDAKCEEVRQALVHLMECLDKEAHPDTIYKADIALRDAIFKSGLHYDLTGDPHKQQDVLSYLETILGIVLELNFSSKMERTAKLDEVEIPTEPVIMTRPFIDIFLDKEKSMDLQSQLDAQFLPKEIAEPINIQDVPFDSYVEQNSLVGNPPDYLVLNIRRQVYDPALAEEQMMQQINAWEYSDWNLTKKDKEEIQSQLVNEFQPNPTMMNTEPLKFPDGDIVSVKFLDKSGKESIAKYQLKSFIVRNVAPLELAAHYTAYVKKDEWYLCDDENIKQVGKEKFNADKAGAYVLFFERV